MKCEGEAEAEGEAAATATLAFLSYSTQKHTGGEDEYCEKHV